MTPSLDDVSLASIPAHALAELAPLRCHDIRVTVQGDRLWVQWRPRADVLPHLLPIRGVDYFAERDGSWYRPGASLPAFDVPAQLAGQPLSALLLPAPVQPERDDAPVSRPVDLRLVRDDRYRPATALRGSLDELLAWAELAPTSDLTAVRGFLVGKSVLVVGEKLPPLPGGNRFWGNRVLIPLGFRTEPDLPESALVRVLGLQGGEVAVLEEGGAIILPGELLAPLTRAGCRLAAP